MVHYINGGHIEVKRSLINFHVKHDNIGRQTYHVSTSNITWVWVWLCRKWAWKFFFQQVDADLINLAWNSHILAGIQTWYVLTPKHDTFDVKSYHVLKLIRLCLTSTCSRLVATDGIKVTLGKNFISILLALYLCTSALCFCVADSKTNLGFPRHQWRNPEF